MGAELIVENIIKIVFLIVGGHLAISKVLPMLEDIISVVFKDKTAIDGFMNLLIVLVLVLVGRGILDFILAMQNPTLAYIGLLKPGFDILYSLVDYFKWIFAGVVVVLAFNVYKKK